MTIARSINSLLTLSLLCSTGAFAQRAGRHWIGTATVSNNDTSSAPKVTATVPVELDLSAPAKNGSSANQ